MMEVYTLSLWISLSSLSQKAKLLELDKVREAVTFNAAKSKSKVKFDFDKGIETDGIIIKINSREPD